MKKKSKVLLAVLLLAVMAYANTVGPNFATSATGTTSTVCGGTAGAWSTPTNADAADGVFTSANTATGNFVTKDLLLQTFGFSIPAGATINGITAEINRKSSTGDSQDLTVQLLKAGVATGANKALATAWPLTAATATYGGAADLWTAAWTPSDINATNFGIVVCAVQVVTGDTASIDFVRITVTFTPASSGSGFLQMFGSVRPQTQTRSAKGGYAMGLIHKVCGQPVRALCLVTIPAKIQVGDALFCPQCGTVIAINECEGTHVEEDHIYVRENP